MGLLNKIKQKTEEQAKLRLGKLIFNTMKPFLTKIGIIVLIAILVIVALSSFWYVIKKDVVTQTSDVIRENGNNPTLTVNSRQYSLDTEFSSKVQKELRKLSINPDTIGLTEELIVKMYKAEIFTSYPDLRKRNEIGSNISEGELQGCIQFNRKYSDNTNILLEYMDFTEFQTELAKLGCYLEDENGNVSSQEQIYMSQEEVNAQYNSIKQYFTLDKEYNLIVATLNTVITNTEYSDYAEEEMAEEETQEGETQEEETQEEETQEEETQEEETQESHDTSTYEYSVNYKRINYQAQVKKYAMPIEFPLSILAITENPSFCEAIIDLVKDSKIVIEIQDNLTTTTTVEAYDYDAYFNIHKKVNYSIDVEVQDNNEQNNDEEERVSVVNRNVITQISKNINIVPKAFRASEIKVGVVHGVIDSDRDSLGGGSGSNTNEDSDTDNNGENTDNGEDNGDEENTNQTHTETRNSSSTTTQENQHLKTKDIENNPFSKVTTIYTQNSINLCVTEVNTWLLNSKAIYARNSTEEITSETVDIADDESFKRVSDYHGFLADIEMSLEPGSYNANMDTQESYIEEKQVNKEKLITSKIEEISYSKISSSIEEKEENFLSLLRINPETGVFDKVNSSNNTQLIKYRNARGRLTSPEDSLLSAKEMLFEFLSLSEESQSFEEIIRYLLYIYTGKSYGVASLNFSIYEAGDFTSIGSGTSGISGVQGQIYDYLLSKGMSSIGAAAVLGNIERESSFRPGAINADNPHYGLCQWGGSRFERLKSEATSVHKEWTDIDVQLDFLWLELNTSYSQVGQELMNATDLYNAVEYFTMHYEVCGGYDTEVPKRYEYAQKWYDLFTQNRLNINHDGVNDIAKYNLNIHNGYIEYKQIDYSTVPPYYQATSSPAGTIKDKGCMPTSISIILSGMGVKDAYGNAYTPETLISTGTMAHINGGSSTAANAINTFRKCGLNASSVKTTSTEQAKNDMLNNLKAGNVLLIHASEGYYTTEGHLMTLIDVDGEQVYLSNPGTRNSNKTGWISLNYLINRNVDWYMVVSR